MNNETVKALLMQSLSGIIDMIKGMGEFAKEQLPLYVIELLKFNAVSSVFYAFVWIIFAVISGVILQICIKKIKELSEHQDCFGYYLGVTFSSFGVIGFSIGFAIMFVEFLKITLAPRVWLVEYLISMVK